MTNALWEPRHHTIITIDIEGFGSPTRTDPIRAGLRQTLETLIDTAVKKMPHAEPLTAVGDTGDGKFLLFRSDLPKTSILQDFTPALEAGIRHHNRAASTAAMRNDVVIVVSDDFFQKIIKPGYGSLDPDGYSPVKISVKETTALVWVNSIPELLTAVPDSPRPTRSMRRSRNG